MSAADEVRAKEAREGALRRVRSMLAMARDAAASEGERDNALRMAHKTMAKHGIDAAEAEAAGTQQEEKRDGLECFTRNQPWTRRMAHAIAELFMCEYYYSQTRKTPEGWVDLRKSGKVRHVFVGRLSNAATARDIAQFCVDSTIGEANRLWKQQADPGPWWSDFCKGASQRIYERCRELRRQAEAESKADAQSTGRSLVLASLYETEREKNALVVKTLVPALMFPKNREKSAGSEGYHAGKKFGDGLSLNRQVAGTKHKELT